MYSSPNEIEIHENKRPDKLYISNTFDNGAGKMRFVSQVSDHSEAHSFVKVKNEIILHVSPGGRQELVARIYEDPRGIESVVIQRFNVENGNPHKTSFSFSGEAVEQLVAFLAGLKTLPLPQSEKIHINADTLKHYLIPDDAKRRIILENEELVQELVRHKLTKSDVVALGYRKEQLAIFYRMLTSPEFFITRKTDWGKSRDEDVWQTFFEQNTWIFGYGLNYVWLSGLDKKKLEQVVSGFSFATDGKRVDALMKTRGFINSLCFVEIKRHDTPLLDKRAAYRSGCWRVSDEVTGSIAQIQKTVQKSVKEMQTCIRLKDGLGNPTGEEVFLYQPKSYVIIGSLKEFGGDAGVNEDQFSSFELFRQGLATPEIITFDELYERAKYIVRHTATQSDPIRR